MITREDCVKIGEITKTHNLQGNVIIVSDSDLLEKYADEPVFLLLDGGPVPFFITEDGVTVRNHSSYIVKFDYVDSLEQAERLMGCEVMIEKALLEEEDVHSCDYDVSALEGFQVFDENSQTTGNVSEVADYAGNVVLTIRILNKDILLPLSDIYIREIDLKESKLLVFIPTELVELN